MRRELSTRERVTQRGLSTRRCVTSMCNNCQADLTEHITETCPYCGQVIYGHMRNIDSGLRKHLEYCEHAQKARESDE